MLVLLHTTKIILKTLKFLTPGYFKMISQLKACILMSNLQVDHFEGMCCPKIRNFIWKLFEEPDSSTAARVSIDQIN